MPQSCRASCAASVTLRYRVCDRADVAQSVEHWLPKPGVVGSSPIVRSRVGPGNRAFLRLDEMPEQPARLSYPDPPLTDGAVMLRRWAESDLGCVEEASRDPHIPEGTTVPARFTAAEGLAWIERQWGRADNGEGLSLAITEAGSDEALGAVVLMFRRQPATSRSATG
jgi:hypothetical protein